MSDGNVEHMGAGGMEAVDAPPEPALFSSPSPQRDPCGLVPRAASAGMEIARVRRRRQATAFDVASHRPARRRGRGRATPGCRARSSTRTRDAGLACAGSGRTENGTPTYATWNAAGAADNGDACSHARPPSCRPDMAGRGARRPRGWPLLGRREPAGWPRASRGGARR